MDILNREVLGRHLRAQFSLAITVDLHDQPHNPLSTKKKNHKCASTISKHHTYSTIQLNFQGKKKNTEHQPTSTQHSMELEANIVHL